MVEELKAEELKREITCSNGKVLKLRPVSERSLRDVEKEVDNEFKADGRQTKPPQYEAPMAGGGSKSYYHDEESIKTATEEEQALWDAYQVCRAEITEAQRERATVVAIIEGVEDEPTQAWLDYMAWRGKDNLPDNPYDLKVRYITYEYLVSPQDHIAFTLATTMLAHGMEVNEADIENALDSFRDTIRGAEGAISKYLAGEIKRATAGGLDLQLSLSEGAGSEDDQQVDR